MGRGIGGYWGKWNVLDLGCKGLVVEMVGGGDGVLLIVHFAVQPCFAPCIYMIRKPESCMEYPCGAGCTEETRQ